MFESRKLTAAPLDPALSELLDEAAEDAEIRVLIELRHGAPPDELLSAVPGASSVGGLFRASLHRSEIIDLTRIKSIHRVWLDHQVKALTRHSLVTIRADAARASFGATGEGIVWAVADSGIAPHSRFEEGGNLQLPEGLAHRDFSGGGSPLSDEYGHGTHVAGIIQSVANRVKLLSLKVLDSRGAGAVSTVLEAIDHIQQVNSYGRRLLIHGVNLSLGYEFDPEWYACGASPLCAEVDRLVASGVVVVVAAGNSGYGFQNSLNTGPTRGCLPLTINDPGNAESAITVGSTHKEKPHLYGVSYFSSKGPTGDGRSKPELVAPGERILSCAAPLKARNGEDWRTALVEESGTSMAAAHVSGAAAGLLSVRREFIGRPQAVKEMLLASAVDLGRDRYFQGRGMLNQFQALQER